MKKSKFLKTILTGIVISGMPVSVLYAHEVSIRGTVPNPADYSLNQMLNRDVTGVVFNEEGEPIAGVSITEKGTTNATVTNEKGQFVLKIEEGAVLQVSYTGYISQEIPEGGQSSFTIKLVKDLLGLEEVVVVGYGTQKKATLTGSVATA